MGNSFVLFDVSIVISHGQFHSGNRGYTQNTDFPRVKSHFPVGKKSSGTATIICFCPFTINCTLHHCYLRPGGGGTPIWNRRGCSSEILNLTPKGDHLGVAQAFCDP